MSETPIWYNKVPKNNSEGQTVRRIDRAWNKAKNNEVNITTARNVPRVCNPGSSEIRRPTQERLEELVEAPLRKAVEIFWDKGIPTNWSDVWSAAKESYDKNEYTMATIGLVTPFLSPHNQQVLRELISEGIVKEGGTRICFPINYNTTTKEIEDFFVEIAHRFEYQEPSDFSDEQIYNLFLQTYYPSTDPSKIALLKCSEEEYNKLPAIQVIKPEKAENEFLEYVRQKELTVEDLVKLLSKKYPQAGERDLYDFFLEPRIDSQSFDEEYKEYKKEFLDRDSLI
jgi:hypothetical protein